MTDATNRAAAGRTIRRRELRAGYQRLGEAVPGPMRAFADLHRAATNDGALSAAIKELMSLAIAITEGCDDCITLHVHDALRAGATREQVHETIGVAVVMGGGPASTYAIRAVDALEEFAGGS